MIDLINLLTNNGIGIVCVAYLIYFQSTTMKKMLETLSTILETLSTINIRLAIIEGKMNIGNEDYLKEVKEIETK